MHALPARFPFSTPPTINDVQDRAERQGAGGRRHGGLALPHALGRKSRSIGMGSRLLQGRGDAQPRLTRPHAYVSTNNQFDAPILAAAGIVNVEDGAAPGTGKLTYQGTAAL